MVMGSLFKKLSDSKRVIEEKGDYTKVIFEGLEDPILLINKRFEIAGANEAAARFAGCPKKELIGKKCYKKIHLQNSPCRFPTVCPVRKVMKKKESVQLSHTHYDGEGNPHLVEVLALPLKDSYGRCTLVVEICRDITEKVKLYENLQASEERFRSIVHDVLDSSEVGVFILDKDFRVVWINTALERYFGLKREDVIGKDKRQLLREKIKKIFEDPDGFEKRVLATYEDNTYIEDFVCHVLPEGNREERWLRHWSRPIKMGLYSGGRIEHYYDITEQYKLMQRLEKRVTDLERLYKAFIGRELQMRQLKEEIRELKKKLGER